MLLILSSVPHMHMHTPAAAPAHKCYACTLMSSVPHMHMPVARPTHTCYACTLTPATVHNVENWTGKSLDRQGVKLLSSVVLDFYITSENITGYMEFLQLEGKYPQ